MKTIPLYTPVLLALPLLLTLSGCSRANMEPTNFEVFSSKAVVSSFGCQNLESEIWNLTYNELLQNHQVPKIEKILKNLSREWQTQKLSDSQKQELQQIFSDIFEVLLKQIPDQEAALLNEDAEFVENTPNLNASISEEEKAHRLLKFLTALELGDQSSPLKVQLQNSLQEKFTTLHKILKDQSWSCAQKIESKAIVKKTDYFQKKAQELGLPLALMGAHKALGVAYRSCESMQLLPMDAVVPKISDKGIVIVGKHSDGVGNRRVYGSVDELVATDYYLNFLKYDPQSVCKNPLTKPLIYDYGGKPFVASAESAQLDFFKNGGSGSQALGIDCSGYVFSSLVTAGLKLSPNKNVKAVQVEGISASMYMNPQQNGLACFDKITLTENESIKPGDVVAVKGHVVMIDQVGADPFGLELWKSENDCVLANMNVENFDFSVAQSSPSKNAIGINRYFAKDYLRESSSMSAGFREYAVQACKAHFLKKFIKFAGSTSAIIRHRGTAECMGDPILLNGEECLKTCESF
jgi:hypothetical protein